MSEKSMAKALPKPINKWILFFYLLLLAKLVLFRVPVANVLDQAGLQTMLEKWSTANLEPFQTIKLYWNWNHHYWSTINLVGNVVALIPFGYLLPASFPKIKFFKTIFIGIIFILLIEFSQLFTGLGEFDVDDILLNFFGVLIGYILFAIRKPKRK